MATFTVTAYGDETNPNDGRTSLREAVRAANGRSGDDEIRFASNIEGGTIVLRQGQLTLDSDVRIDGDRDNDGRQVTIDGDGESRLFRIEGGGTQAAL
jgi:CSLREA domain-containing protein